MMVVLGYVVDVVIRLIIGAGMLCLLVGLGIEAMVLVSRVGRWLCRGW